MSTPHTPHALHRLSIRGRHTGHVQLLFVLAGLGLGLATPRITRGPEMQASLVTGMLVSLGPAVLGVVTLIFSLLLGVVQWMSSTFTPRLTMLGDSPLVRRTYGFTVGVTVFCITVAVDNSIAGRTEISVIVPGIAILLLVVVVALVRKLLLGAFTNIQLAHNLSSIATQGREVLDTCYPETTGPTSSPLPPLHSTITWPRPVTTLQKVHLDRLLAAAEASNAVIVLRETPGTTLQQGTPVTDIHGAELPASTVLDGLEVGTARTFEQDPLFAFQLLADIALRALRTNDPASTIQTLDYLEDLLGRAVSQQTGPRRVADRSGALRLVIHYPGWEDFARTGLDSVIAAAMDFPTVLVRIRLLLERVRNRAQPDRHDLLTDRLAWVTDELTTRFTHLQRHET
ncbi:DUF2254 family protein [Rhodococcus sp. NPDC127530]|uniref:DUF2254 family protein n=1 Tax=unclassified Rhodococcus (in: high G+C Gram-positive bacteria) TaxID=192944 RepID=UPI00363A1C32